MSGAGKDSSHVWRQRALGVWLSGLWEKQLGKEKVEGAPWGAFSP